MMPKSYGLWTTLFASYRDDTVLMFFSITLQDRRKVGASLSPKDNETHIVFGRANTLNFERKHRLADEIKRLPSPLEKTFQNLPVSVLSGGHLVLKVVNQLVAAATPPLDMPKFCSSPKMTLPRLSGQQPITDKIFLIDKKISQLDWDMLCSPLPHQLTLFIKVELMKWVDVCTNLDCTVVHGTHLKLCCCI